VSAGMGLPQPGQSEGIQGSRPPPRPSTPRTSVSVVFFYHAVRDLHAAHRTLERMIVTPEQARAVAAVRAARAELRAVVPPDDRPRDC